MAKGLRSNNKKALRTIRRNSVKVSDFYQKQEAERLARMQKTLDAVAAAKQAEEAAIQQGRAVASVAPMQQDRGRSSAPPATDRMDIDSAPSLPRKGKTGKGLQTKKKGFKMRKKKADGINTLHKKKAKGRKRK